jgi:hypothetical protein
MLAIPQAASTDAETLPARNSTVIFVNSRENEVSGFATCCFSNA